MGEIKLNELITTFTTHYGDRIRIRPIRPTDLEGETEFLHRLSAESKRFRFLENFKELSPKILIKFTNVDFEKDMALVATHTHNKNETIVGIARYSLNPDEKTCNCAIVIEDKWQNQGIGYTLLSLLIKVASDRGLNSMTDTIQSNNHAMLELAKSLNFVISKCDDDPTLLTITKNLS